MKESNLCWGISYFICGLDLQSKIVLLEGANKLKKRRDCRIPTNEEKKKKDSFWNTGLQKVKDSVVQMNLDKVVVQKCK